MAAIFILQFYFKTVHTFSMSKSFQEHFGENRFSILLLVNEIGPIYENSKGPPDGHLVCFDQHEFQFGPTRHQGDSMCEVSEL